MSERENVWPRRLVLLQVLIQRGSLTTREAAKLVNITRRKALNDFKELSANGVPLTIEGEDKDRRWVLLDSWRQFGLDLGLRDRLALLFGRELVASFLHDTDFADALRRLETHFAALDGTLALAPDHLARRFYCLHEPEKDYSGHRQLLDTLVRALLDSHKISYRYTSAAGEPKEHRLVEPLTLAVYKRGLYLIWQRKGRTYTHAVERITALEPHPDDGFEYPRPSEYEPRRALGDRFGISSDGRDPALVRLRFDPSVRTYATSRRWTPDCQVTDLPDGGCEITFVAHGYELVSHVLQYGPKVQVLEPAWLRDAVVADLRAALARYDAAPPPPPPRTDVQCAAG